MQTCIVSAIILLHSSMEIAIVIVNAEVYSHLHLLNLHNQFIDKIERKQIEQNTVAMCPIVILPKMGNK